MKRGVLRKALLLALFCISLTGMLLLQEKHVYAAGTPVKVVAVEYYDEQIVVQNNGNTKICFASEVEAAKDNWEVIDADSGSYTTIDISWLSTTVENILVFKGADDTTNTKSRVIINEKPLKLDVAINYNNLDGMAPNASIAPLVNIMSDVGTGSKPITFTDLEWKKGTTGQWQSTKSLDVSKLTRYLVKGTYLYFRIRAVDDVVTTSLSTAAVNPVNFDDYRYNGKGGFSDNISTVTTLGTDFPDGTEGRRFSNEVKVKVAKKATAMVYGIDGEEFTAEIKYGKEYRVTYGSSTTPTGWTKITDRAVKTLPLSTIINSTTDNGITVPFKAMKIEVRDYATSKAASSKITEIYLNAQRQLTLPIIVGDAPLNAITNADPNIYVSYNGNKNMVLEIPKATPELPYEYCVVKFGESFDVTRVVWTAVTKGTAVKILASKAVEKGTLYVRQKEIKSKEATNNSAAVAYALASTHVLHLISYPSVPEIVDASYTFTKGGYSGAITFTATLNAVGKAPFETTIKSIKLGTKDIEYTTATATTGGISTMTITLKADSLSTLTNCFAKAITITYNKGTVDKTSIKLTIQSPVAAGTLTYTNAKGATTTGTTAFTMVTSKAAGNSWVYVITAAEIPNAYTVDKVANLTAVTAVAATVNAFTTTTVDDITVTAGQYLTVFEVNATGYIVKYKCTKITTDYIK